MDIATELHCPVLGLYGGKDDHIPQADIDRMRAAAQTAGKEIEIVVYPEAGHAFHADYRPSYHQASAEDGWKRLTAFFAARLGAA